MVKAIEKTPILKMWHAENKYLAPTRTKKSVPPEKTTKRRTDKFDRVGRHVHFRNARVLPRVELPNQLLMHGGLLLLDEHLGAQVEERVHWFVVAAQQLLDAVVFQHLCG